MQWRNLDLCELWTINYELNILIDNFEPDNF